MSYLDEVATDEVFGSLCLAMTRWPLDKTATEFALMGKWWMVKAMGESLVTTAKAQMGTKVMALFDLPVRRRDLEQCDNCWGYSFLCAGEELGDEHNAFLWYCHDCKTN